MKNTTKLMILMRLFYSIFKSFILIFVNIYLWEAGKDIQSVAIFNIFNYIGATVSYYLANMIALKSIRYNYMLSSISFMFAFGLTVALGANIAQYALLIGILGGFGDGLFFFNLNTFQANELDKEEIDQFMSIIGGLNKAASIITPIISGIIIEKLGFVYMVNFLMIILALQLVLSFKMPDRKMQVMGKFRFKRLFEGSSYSKMLWTNISKSPYQQFTNMANSVFLFTLISSETIIGVLNSVFAAISILMYIIYRYLLIWTTRKKAMLMGAIVSSLVFLLLFKPTITTFIIFGIAVSFGNAFFNTPMVGIQIRAAKDYSFNQKDLLGNLMYRVIILNTGRVIFFTLVYFFYTDFTSPIFYFFLIFNIISSPLTYALAREEI